jgi:hypothetical protein
MPDILVEVRGDWLSGRQIRFLDAIHDALSTVLRYPKGDKLLRLIEHPLHNFLTPHASGPHYTRIEIVLFSGRSLDAKRASYRALVEALAPFSVPAEDVKIVMIEIPPDNVGFRGGKAACDLELGYSLSI